MKTQIDNWGKILHEFQREYNQLDIKFNNLPPLERKAIKNKYIKIIEQEITLAKEEEREKIKDWIEYNLNGYSGKLCFTSDELIKLINKLN